MSAANSNSTLLCLDTSTEACSVALQYRGSIFSRFEVASRKHTRLLLPMIDDVLAEARLDLSSINALGFTVGPGSFTGVRIGFGVAQGIAYGADLPVVPVSSLEAMAVSACHRFKFPVGSLLLSIMDARMDECYWALFCVADNNELQRLCNDSLCAPEQINLNIAFLSHENSDLHLIGDGWNYADRLSLQPASVAAEFYPDAKAVLTIAVNKFDEGAFENIERVQPLYLRDRITWKKRRRLRDAETSAGNTEQNSNHKGS